MAKYAPAKPTPSYEEMDAYESGYNMAQEERTIMARYEDAELQSAFERGWQDRLNKDWLKDLMNNSKVSK